jgi:cellulose biosynthesis protein BcsQ
MALANIACALAQRQHQRVSKGVLMVDWDLEAPGLHRFFRNRLELSLKDGLRSIARSDANSSAQGLGQQLGLIDLFCELDRSVSERGLSPEEQSEELADDLIRRVDLGRFVLRTEIPGLSLLTAGRFDSGYSSRVNTFRWDALYNRSPFLFRAFAEKLEDDYQYVLIDSRTGLSDISGICTMLMPSILVVVFTPNLQSLTGIQNLVREATNYRRQSSDLRPLLVFPLASRIDTGEKDLREMWRFGNRERNIVGYQREFEGLFREVYRLSECSLDKYFDEVLVQYLPRYSYGEEIAVLTERTDDRLSLKRFYVSFSETLTAGSGPWQRSESTALEHAKESDVPISGGLSARAYATFAFVALLLAIGFAAFYVYQVPKFVQAGVQSQIFYLLLLPWALSCAAFLYGTLRSYARLSYKNLGNFLELGGPVVLFFLVFLGGFKLVPQSQSFDLTVRPIGPYDALRSGSVILDLGSDRRVAPISANGEANFRGIPQRFWGSSANIFIEAAGYATISRQYTVNRTAIDLPVEPARAQLTILNGTVSPAPRKQQSVVISVDGQDARTRPDASGAFRLQVAGKEGDRIRLKVSIDGKIVYDNYQILPGPVAISLRPSQ